MLERVIEERAHGDADAANTMRQSILDLLGTELRELRPGSPEAARLKQHLVAEGMWSQYLEVGIGPDAELFTKAPVLATVGTATEVGIRSDSEWNNPEPEVVLLVASTGRDRRGVPRQRRQPARPRGAFRAAARRGEGQQRLGGCRPVHPAVR